MIIKSTRVAVTLGLSATMALSACSVSSGSSPQSAKSASSSSSSSTSSPTSSATSASSSTSDTSSGSSTSSSASGSTVDDEHLKSMAGKLGCPSPEVSEPTAKAKAAGAVSGVKCDVGSTLYMLVRVSSSDRIESFMKAFAGDTKVAGGIPYVKGANWLVFTTGTGENDDPTKAEAQAVQQKVGGAVTVLN